MGLCLVGVELGSVGRGEGRVWEDVVARVVGEGGSGIGSVGKGKGSVGKGVCVVSVLSVGVWVVLVEHTGQSGAWWLCWGPPCGSCEADIAVLFLSEKVIGVRSSCLMSRLPTVVPFQVACLS